MRIKEGFFVAFLRLCAQACDALAYICALRWLEKSVTRGKQHMRRFFMRYIIRETEVKIRLGELLSQEPYNSFQFRKDYPIAGAYFDFYSHSLKLTITIITPDMDALELQHKNEVISYQKLYSFSIKEDYKEDDIAAILKYIKKCKEEQNSRRDIVKYELWKIIQNKQWESLEFFKDRRIAGITFDFYCPQLKIVIIVNSFPKSLHQVLRMKDVIMSTGLQHFCVDETCDENQINIVLGIIKGLKELREEQLVTRKIVKTACVAGGTR